MECAVDVSSVVGEEDATTGESLKQYLHREASPGPNGGGGGGGGCNSDDNSGSTSKAVSGPSPSPQKFLDKDGRPLSSPLPKQASESPLPLTMTGLTQPTTSGNLLPMPVLRTVAPSPSRKIGADLGHAFSATSSHTGVGASTSDSLSTTTMSGSVPANTFLMPNAPAVGHSSFKRRNSGRKSVSYADDTEEHHPSSTAGDDSFISGSSYLEEGSGAEAVAPVIGVGKSPALPPPLNPTALGEARPLSGPSGELLLQNDNDKPIKTGSPHQSKRRQKDSSGQRGRHAKAVAEAEADGPIHTESPSRNRKRLDLLSSQFDALETALTACDKEVLPCVVQFLRASKSLEAKQSQQHRWELNRLQDTIDSINAEKEELVSEMAAAKEKLSASASRHLEEREQFQKRIRLLEEAIGESKSSAFERAAAEAQRVASEISTWKDSAQSMASQRDAAVKELSELRARVEATTSASSLATKQFHELQELLKASTAKEAQLAASLAKSEAMSRTYEELAAQLRAKQQTDVEGQRKDAISATDKIRSLESALADANKVHQASQHQHSQLLAATEAKMKEFEKNIGSHQAAQAAAALNKDELDRLLDESRAAVARLTTEKESLTADREAMQRQLQQATTNSATDGKELRRISDTHAAEIASLKDRLAATKIKFDSEMKAKIEGLESTIAGLKATAEEARRRAEAAEFKMKEAVTERNKIEKGALEAAAASDMAAKQRSDQLARQQEQVERLSAAANEKLKRIKLVQTDSLNAIAKLQAVERSCESSYSCQSCLAVVKAPLMCAPCGHMFCKSCLEDANRNKMSTSNAALVGTGRVLLFCPECDVSNILATAPSKQMDALASKFEYRQKVLEDLETLMRSVGAQQD
eukprot:GILI01013566.1.p1 GENE.GILI01013566.1~~GILI01013566.1.p1  ORF type:complete len:928 (-),score=231.56 GILI01013566.1:89-2710(-)